MGIRKKDGSISEGLFSSKSNEWETPQSFFDFLDHLFGPFDLDPCATEDNAKCDLFYTIEDNGLEKDWHPHRTFFNPPYGREIPFWIKKASIEASKGADVIGLIPARTDTKYWDRYILLREGVTIHFVVGRIKFGKGNNSAPFPSAVIHWRADLSGPFQIGDKIYARSVEKRKWD